MRITNKLRFKEFNDEWKKESIGSLFDFFSNNSFSRSKLNYNKGLVRNIHYGDIHTKFPSITNCEIEKIPFININENLKKIKKEDYCKNGDLIIADASEDYEDIGKAIELVNIKNNKKIVAGLHTILLRDTSNNFVEGFKGFMFQNFNLKKQIKIIANGISVLGISKNNLSKIKVFYPSKNEQKKIAGFFLKIDNKINFLNKKLEYYEKFKKFLLQQLFTQKLRFKNYSNKWNLYTLNELGNTFTGLSGKTKKDFNKGNSRYITYKSVFDSEKIDISQLDSVQIKDNEKQNKVEKNDIFFTTSSETPEEVGMVSVLKNNVSNCYLNSFCFGYRLNENINVNSTFLTYYLSSPIIREKIKKLAQGSTRYNLSKKEVMKLKLFLPSIEEQIKIKTIIEKIDLKINLVQKQIELTEKYKKGLLQQMFKWLFLYLNKNIFTR